MKTFQDIRNQLKQENPALYNSLEKMGEIMSARCRKGITQTKLAELSGVSQGKISRLENGKDIATLPILRKLEDALAVVEG